MILKMC